MSTWPPLAWPTRRLRPAGDAALRGLEAELSRVTAFDEGWERVCDTAWSLGFVELRLAPSPGTPLLLETRLGFARRPWPRLPQRHDGPRAEATWTIPLTLDGRAVGTLTARGTLSRVDFDPMRLVAAVQGLVDRFVATAGAPSESKPECDVGVTGHGQSRRPEAKACNASTPPARVFSREPSRPPSA